MNVGTITKRKIYFNREAEPYFKLYGIKHYFKDISTDTRTDTTCYTNAGYFGNFKFIGLDSDSEKAIIEIV